VCDGPGLPVRGRDRGPSEEPQEQQPPRTANGVAQIGKHVLCSGFASERAGQVGESGRFALLFRRRPGSALAEGLGPATETKRRAFVLCITPVLLTLDSVGHQMACAEQPRFASASRAAFCSGTRCRLGEHCGAGRRLECNVGQASDLPKRGNAVIRALQQRSPVERLGHVGARTALPKRKRPTNKDG
jgi:hypothetical protein